MSRIANAFQKGTALIAFLTAGDPGMPETVELVLEMERSGADLIEIGIPFSDPVAEGPVIEQANQRALAAGTKLEDVFLAVREIRRQSQVPLVFLTYLNPVFHHGYGKFFQRCRETGVDGIIIPDLPFEEKAEVKEVAEENGVDLISMVAPTSGERLAAIASSAKGFLYVVSSMGVTGVRSQLGGEKTESGASGIEDIVGEIRRATHIPCAVGFGIHTPSQAREMGRLADGVIVGSAIVDLIGKYGKEAKGPLGEYIRSMKAALQEE